MQASWRLLMDAWGTMIASGEVALWGGQKEGRLRRLRTAPHRPPWTIGRLEARLSASSLDARRLLRSSPPAAAQRLVFSLLPQVAPDILLLVGLGGGGGGGEEEEAAATALEWCLDHGAEFLQVDVKADAAEAKALAAASRGEAKAAPTSGEADGSGGKTSHDRPSTAPPEDSAPNAPAWRLL